MSSPDVCSHDRAPTGSTHVPLIVGSITFGMTIIATLSALSARETYRIHMNDLGRSGAEPVPLDEYERIREHQTSR